MGYAANALLNPSTGSNEESGNGSAEGNNKLLGTGSGNAGEGSAVGRGRRAKGTEDHRTRLQRVRQ